LELTSVFNENAAGMKPAKDGPISAVLRNTAPGSSTRNEKDSSAGILTSSALSPATKSTSRWSSSFVRARAPLRLNTSLPLTQMRMGPLLPTDSIALPALARARFRYA